MSTLAVIDTETNWDDEVMSIGLVIADDSAFQPISYQYFLVDSCHHHGMYSETLPLEVCFPRESLSCQEKCCSFERSMAQIRQHCREFAVQHIFAYNASFDYHHLPGLQDFSWYDIIQKAAYAQHNQKITADAPLWSTGRLKRNYGVESIYRLLSGQQNFFEKHNALHDALVELEIMALLGYQVTDYRCLQQKWSPRRRPRISMP